MKFIFRRNKVKQYHFTVNGIQQWPGIVQALKVKLKFIWMQKNFMIMVIEYFDLYILSLWR